MSDVACPCCGDEMDAYQVVCWPCYRATDRLALGNHNLDKTGWTVNLTAEDIAKWDRARELRMTTLSR